MISNSAIASTKAVLENRILPSLYRSHKHSDKDVSSVVIHCRKFFSHFPHIGFGRITHNASLPDRWLQQVSFAQSLDTIMVFINSHLMLSHRNQLAIIAAHTDSCKVLFPKEDQPSQKDAQNGESVRRGGINGQYELFTEVNLVLQEQLKTLILNDSNVQATSDSLIAGAMCTALCFIHRKEKECSYGETLSSRILIIKGSEDNPSQYMNFMNVVFTAQKQNIVIDACILDNESGLLQQACDITGGIYLKIPQMTGLLQYLQWVFLPDPSTRNKLTLPPKVQVDYRAACFCHRNLIDIGYVCSVCLSIFCTFSPICSTCQTTFKFLGPPKALKKKSKKTMPSS